MASTKTMPGDLPPRDSSFGDRKRERSKIASDSVGFGAKRSRIAAGLTSTADDDFDNLDAELIEREPSVYEETHLMLAVRLVTSWHDEHAEMIRSLLIDPAVNVNEQDQRGLSALHKACSHDISSDIGAKLLLSDERCDVNIANGHGNTPLMWSVMHTSAESDKHHLITKHLLSHPQICVNKRNRYLQTALHRACSRQTQSHYGALMLIADPRCDVNIQDVNGQTALQTAVHFAQSSDDRYGRIIEALLKTTKIDVNAVSTRSETALDEIEKRLSDVTERASATELQKIGSLLRSRGAAASSASSLFRKPTDLAHVYDDVNKLVVEKFLSSSRPSISGLSQMHSVEFDDSTGEPHMIFSHF